MFFSLFYRFAVSKDLTADTTFNLTCPAGSGAPVAINTDLKKGVDDKKDDADSLRGSKWYMGFCVVLGLTMWLF